MNNSINGNEVQRIIVVGASAGGIFALQDLVKGLPANFTGSIFIVLHVPPHPETHLPSILSKAGHLPALLARNGDPILPGTIYIAPNDHHLLLETNKIVVVKGPKENRFRPSIDALFRSAAYEYGSAVIGVILSGTLQDGASGLFTIKRLGGTAIIQDPVDAQQSKLPENVLEDVIADYVSKAVDMGPLIEVLLQKDKSKEDPLSEVDLKKLESELIMAKNGKGIEIGLMGLGELTPFTCPACHGTLIRLKEGNMLRFRCHTGHAYSSGVLLEEVSESVELLLWQSVRVIEEKAMLEKTIAKQLRDMKHTDAAIFEKKADLSLKRAAQIHDLIFKNTNTPVETPAAK